MRSGEGTTCCLHLRETGLFERRSEDPFPAEAERPRLPRRRWRQVCPAPDDADRDREERVALRCGVDDRRDPPPWSQHPAGFGQCSLLVREIDQPDPGGDDIERVVRDIQVLAVHDPGLEVGQAAICSGLRGEGEDGRGDVRRQDGARRADPFGDGQCGLSSTAGQVKDAIAGSDPGQVEHHPGRFTEPGFDGWFPSVPGVLPPAATAPVSSPCSGAGRTASCTNDVAMGLFLLCHRCIWSQTRYACQIVASVGGRCGRSVPRSVPWLS